LGKRQLAVILLFALLLTAGLNYAGRNMYRSLGGDKKFYAFLLPDLPGGRVVFCGRAYAQYQAVNLWDRHAAALGEFWSARHASSNRGRAEKSIQALRDHWQSLQPRTEALTTRLRSLLPSSSELFPEAFPEGR
jgi:hypothetical protein